MLTTNKQLVSAILFAALGSIGQLIPQPAIAADEQTLTLKCRAARHKIIGAFSKCVAKAEAKAIRKETEPDHSACLPSFERQWQRARTKYEAQSECYQPAGFWHRASQLVLDRNIYIKDLMKTEKRVFVTSRRYPSDFGNQRLAGGLVSFDLQCGALAHSAGLGGHWVAWMSSSQENAVDRLIGGGPFKRLDGIVVADSIADLTDGSLYAPISIDERGVLVDENTEVWTGTDENGLLIPGKMCDDWTAANGDVEEGQLGLSNQANVEWSNWFPVFCNGLSRIYCIEQ